MPENRFFLLDVGASRPSPAPLPPSTTLKAGPADTEGRLSLTEVHGDAPSPGTDELVYVLDGELKVELDGTPHRLTAGMFALLPPGTRDPSPDLHSLHLSLPADHGENSFYVLQRGQVRPGRVQVPPAFGIKARSEDTDGLISLLEVTVAQPVPRHTHHVADECVYVVDGVLEIDFEGTTHRIGKGRFVLLPHGVPHAIRPGSTPPPKVVQISSPGGWECVVEALIEHRAEVSRGGRFDPAALNRHTRRHHVVYDEEQ